ncbi:30S ribosomal protein S4 [Fodinicola acaciae]|uniref:30S ribosomal protein S4 n=1 Tax=Fodinicola acaciae TaxID=2681555 RepID=UPI0013D2B4B0|nr:30S ribosomal protein S4 [Fodinicola acaciae]
MNRSRPKARLSRALGIPLTPKCVRYFEARPYPPGVHGRARRNPSDYGIRLREKQRLRHQYNIGEAQLERAFAEARRRPGKTGENLVASLERRLDAVVMRSGLARTIYQARQMVVHRHITVNGKRVDRPSYQVQLGDVVGVIDRSKSKAPFVAASEGTWAAANTPGYLSTDLKNLKVQLVAEPTRAQVPVICDEQLVVEFYAR